jgi:mannose-1-phosphate guanylyltransferase/mannose-6-phosphate isomerase
MMPKQMLPLATNASLFQETVRRVDDGERFEAPLIICNQAHRFVIAEQMRELDIEPHAIVLEPEGRNTAPALAIAAIMMEDFLDRPLFVMPSDHAIEDFEKLLPAIDRAVEAAAQGVLVTFGLFPKAPEICYGYVQRGNSLLSAPEVFEVSRFIEKPDRATAESLISSGDCFWNSGMFLFSARSYLTELERFQPEIVISAQAALSNKKQNLDFLHLDETAFLASPAMSIDHAVMERTKHAAVVPANIAWRDLGS